MCNTILRISFLISMIVSSCAMAATHQQQAFMQQFQTSRVQFPGDDSPYADKTAGQYPGPLRYLLQNVLAWSPTGEGRSLSAKCSTELWSARLQDPRVRVSVQLQGALVQ